MARDDECVFEVARKVILAGVNGDLDTIRYRQDILQDCLAQPAIVRELYAVAVEAMEKQRRHFLGGVLARYPDQVLRHSIDLMSVLLEFQKKLRKIADAHADKFVSEGWAGFFAALKRELDDDYLLMPDNIWSNSYSVMGCCSAPHWAGPTKAAITSCADFPSARDMVGTVAGLVDALRRLLPHREETCPIWLRPRQSPVYSF